MVELANPFITGFTIKKANGYSLPGFKLGFLDNRGLDTALSKMNNLDQFI